MLTVTTWASLERGVLTAGRELIGDRWFQATLIDAYFGFITFYVWVAYKETKFYSKILWLLSILTLGNIAMAIFMLKELVLYGNRSLEELLVTRN